MTLKEAFKIYSHKGPVDREGAQRSAEAAFRVLRPYLTSKEISDLFTAQGHALIVGEGRQEFDEICKKIKERLFNG